MLFAAAAAAEVDTVALLCLGSLAGAITQACELAAVGCQAGSLSCVVVLGASHVHDFKQAKHL